MKRLIIITLVLMLAATAMGQISPIDAGSRIVAGSISFTHQGGDLYTRYGKSTTQINVAPSLEFFITPNFLVGGSFSYQSISRGGQTVSFLSFGAVTGYYFGNPYNTEVKGTVYPYVKALFHFLTPDNYSITSLGAKVGINYMLSKTVALDAGLLIQNDSYSYEESNNSVNGTVIMFGTGVSAFIY